MALGSIGERMRFWGDPVANTFGLRAQILLHILLLAGAALLFAGFLFLRLTESALLDQRVSHAVATMEVFSRTLAATMADGGPAEADLRGRTRRLQDFAGSLPPNLGWGAVDRNLSPVSSAASLGAFSLDLADLAQVRESRRVEIQVHYPPTGIFSVTGGDGFVVATAPVLAEGSFAGALQVRFSLGDVRARIFGGRTLVLAYALLFGTVMVGFGFYLLSRTVVRPIGRLMEGTRRVAAGNLAEVLPVEGPREIAQLAGSFNAMTGALADSRRETEAYISSLQRTNEDLRRTQEDLVRSEKMASVGHLAAGMAHEIGNPLGAVVGYLDLLRGELPEGREREIADRSLGEARRIDRLVKDLLDYAAPGGGDEESFDPLAALVEARDLLQHQGAFEGLSVDGELPAMLPAVTMARHKLLQVFVNLLLNARDVSPPGGAVSLAAGVVKEGAWISVRDEGEGMDGETMAHIFDPFFTTKEPGRGRGLGLFVCHRVLDEAGGRIEVQSEPGSGCVFTVHFPISKAQGEG
ncbi:MAG: two-component sensor histidine kinase [Desulfuromonas sp.]|nr:MAG: two-component sensor histidine kinase [Desulfuromonas sp.]